MPTITDLEEFEFDILEELRACHWCDGEDFTCNNCRAADEIVRLRADNSRLRQWFSDNAATLAAHRIGGYEFVDPASGRQSTEEK